MQIGDNVIPRPKGPGSRNNKVQIVDARVESKSTIALSYGVETKKKTSIILVESRRQLKLCGTYRLLVGNQHSQ